MRKIFLIVVLILFFLFPVKAKADESCSASPSPRIVGSPFELVCTELDPQKKYRLLLNGSEECQATTITESQLSPDNNGRLSKNVTYSGVVRNETAYIKLYEQSNKSTCELWNDPPVFYLESEGIAPTPTPTLIPSPTKGPCVKDDKICDTENECTDPSNPNQCQNYHCVLTPIGDEVGTMIKTCQFKPGFIAPTPTPTPPPPPCFEWEKIADKTTKLTSEQYAALPDEQKKEYKCTAISTGLGIPIKTNPADFIKSLFGILLGLSGGIALLLIIVSGYRLMASAGNPEKLQGAREMLTSAIVGLLFIIFSFVILQVIGVDILKIPGLGD